MINNHGNNTFIIAIVNALFEVSSQSDLDEAAKLADEIVSLLLQAFPLSNKNTTDLINIPYKDITDIVFYSDKRIDSDSIENFKEIFKESLKKCDAYRNLKDEVQIQNIFISHFVLRYEKIVEHTRLAQAQRDFIKQSINIAIENKLDAVKDIKIIADKAEQTAKQAENIYQSMFANYVTILGVFTAIIVTIFGGLNIINTTTSSIDKGNIALILLLTALLMLCQILLLYFLAKIIAWLTGRARVNLGNIFSRILIACIVIIAISGLFLYLPPSTAIIPNPHLNTQPQTH